MHAILHSFAYPLKPLTQASISIQPIPILRATHDNVLPHPDVSHPEFLSAAFPSGCLTLGIPSPPPFPWVSHPEFLPAAIPSGCLTPRIPLRRLSIPVSHSRNSSLPPFHPGVSLPEFLPAALPSGCLTPGILLRHSTFFGCVTSGILSSRRSTFFFILRAFSLGSKITFLIKLCCRFYFWQAIFILPPFLKCFEISKESNSEQWSYRN